VGKNLGILIPRQLTIEQYIKLFSNPVSGIACEVDAYNRDHRVKYHTKNIRYSKSMIMKALGFWHEQMWNYYKKISRINNPLDPNTSEFKDEHSPTLGRKVFKQCDDILQTARLVSKLPDTFLFSHRHIDAQWGTSDSKGMIAQHQLLSNKYPMLFKTSSFTGYTTDNKKELCCSIETIIGIKFTIFPNEHPYIPRQKISRVGMTEKGNVFVMMDNGADKRK
jgi:hypothetical protein